MFGFACGNAFLVSGSVAADIEVEHWLFQNSRECIGMYYMKTMSAVVLLIGLSSMAQAQQDETRIRSEAGGIYRTPSFGQGSVSGYPSDIMSLRAPNGALLAQLTLAEWANSVWIPEYYPIVDVQFNSGGQMTVRFNYARLSLAYPALPGGTVAVCRGSMVVDSDRLY
jgi:hypothetical protein